MEIFLIRHGEQEYPHDEHGKKMVSSPLAPLTELGRLQMRQLKQEFDAEGITLDAIYRSPFPRAEQSAEELGGQAILIYVLDDLKEDDPNSAEGHTYDEIEKVGGDLYAHPFGPQESLDQVIARGRAAIEFILSDAKKHGYEMVAIIGHGDPLCALDWGLKHADNPTSYSEMRDSYYPQKGQAIEYVINSNLKIEGEGRLIKTETSEQTIEGFRNSHQTEKDSPIG